MKLERRGQKREVVSLPYDNEHENAPPHSFDFVYKYASWASFADWQKHTGSVRALTTLPQQLFVTV